MKTDTHLGSNLGVQQGSIHLKLQDETPLLALLTQSQRHFVLGVPIGQDGCYDLVVLKSSLAVTTSDTCVGYTGSYTYQRKDYFYLVLKLEETLGNLRFAPVVFTSWKERQNRRIIRVRITSSDATPLLIAYQLGFRHHHTDTSVTPYVWYGEIKV